MKRAAVLLIALSLLAACGGKEAKPLSERGEKLYALDGRIVSKDTRANSLTVDHKAIAGFMEAMTMEYPVRGANVDALPGNDAHITARLHVTERGYWLTDVKKAP